MIAKEFLSSYYIDTLDQFEVIYEAPSNIALVKYWGKFEHQMPANPSISFTLKHSKTITKVSFKKRQSKGIPSFDLYFEGTEKQSFKPKIENFINHILPYCSYLEQYHLTIDTLNTFPHSSGIASSASGLAALACCIMDLERTLNNQITPDYFLKKASFLARIGSGSAARSIEGPMMLWGQSSPIADSSNYYAIPFKKELHDVFKDYQDAILLIHEGQKSVSSTAGHDLMKNHPFAKKRFDQAPLHLAQLLEILKNGSLDAFIHLVELEALTLHAMMMTSSPYYLLMQPHTLSVIQRVWDFRKRTQIPLCFTLDAGANVHLLYPKIYGSEVTALINNELVRYCSNGKVIFDEVGTGALKIE